MDHKFNAKGFPLKRQSLWLTRFIFCCPMTQELLGLQPREEIALITPSQFSLGSSLKYSILVQAPGSSSSASLAYAVRMLLPLGLDQLDNECSFRPDLLGIKGSCSLELSLGSQRARHCCVLRDVSPVKVTF